MPKEPALTPVNGSKGDPEYSVPGTLPDDLYDYYTSESEPRRSPQSKDDPTTWRVVDDWPERVPITEAEIEVFERWFADVFDELFGPGSPEEGLTELSQSDNKTR
ncbi:hypothetical protein V5F85_21900 [Xanthobacter autotrophicus ATCC 700551]